MHESKRDRKARPTQLARLSAAAQAPATLQLPAPSNAVMVAEGGREEGALSRVLGEKGYSGGGEGATVPAGFYRPPPGDFDCDCGCCSFCTRGLLPTPEPQTPDAAPQTAQGGPPRGSLPRERSRRGSRGLLSPHRASRRKGRGGQNWRRRSRSPRRWRRSPRRWCRRPSPRTASRP